MFVSALQHAKMFGRVVLVVTVRIADSMQAHARLVAAVGHDIQTVERIQQALSHPDVDIDSLNFDRVFGADSRRGHSIQLPVLV